MNSKENQNSNNALDMNAVEMIFGTPSSPKQGIPEVHHMITNERKHTEKELNPGKDVTDDVETVPTQPLLEPERERQKPPLAGPEIDDLDGDVPGDAAPFRGIDDGLLETEDKKPEGQDNDGADDHKSEDGDHPYHEDGGTMADGKWFMANGLDEPDFPHDGINGFANRFDDRPISPMIPGTIIPDVNTYQQKKNLAQGMMDLALLSANANQLRYVLESSSNHPYYYPSLVFISLSIIFQVAVGIGLILNSRYDVNHEKEICKADKINNLTVLGVFLVTIVNVFITSFSVATPNMQPAGPITLPGGG